MPSRSMLMWRPEKVCTAPIPGGALTRTFTGLGGFRFSGSLCCCSCSVHLEDVLAGERLLEPFEKLRGGINLIVMFAIGGNGHLVQVLGKPGGALRSRFP